MEIHMNKKEVGKKKFVPERGRVVRGEL